MAPLTKCSSQQPQDVFLQGLPTEGLLESLTMLPERSFNAPPSSLFSSSTVPGFGTTSLWDPADLLVMPAPPANDPLSAEMATSFADLGGVSWGLGVNPAPSEGLWYGQGPFNVKEPLLAGGSSLQALGFVTRDEDNGPLMPADVPIPAVVKQPRGRNAALCPDYQRGYCRCDLCCACDPCVTMDTTLECTYRLGSRCVLTHDNVLASSSKLPPVPHSNDLPNVN